MTRTLTVLLLVVLVAGCSDDSEPEPTATSPSPATSATSAAPTPVVPTAVVTTPAAVSSADPAQVCAFLEAAASELASAGSPADARARFVSDLGLWTIGGPGRRLDDTTELDTIATASCPQARTALLTVLGVDSLDAAVTT